jgi:hypothetical protein
MVAMHPALQQERTFLQEDILEPSAAHAFSPSPERACPVPQKWSDGSAPGDAAWPANPYSSIPFIAPLTAYNYFYRNERDTIVRGMTKAGDPLPPSDMDFTSRKMTELLHYHWTVDPYKKKRQHKKTHGVIDFATLARAISSRWKLLPKRGREFYHDVADVDQRRYEAYWAEFRSSSLLSTT